ncbi:MAG: hypothetical protein ACTSYG_10910 [Candidatus Heimdallarchaeota archaeon]
MKNEKEIKERIEFLERVKEDLKKRSGASEAEIKVDYTEPLEWVLEKD